MTVIIDGIKTKCQWARTVRGAVLDVYNSKGQLCAKHNFSHQLPDNCKVRTNGHNYIFNEGN